VSGRVHKGFGPRAQAVRCSAIGCQTFTPPFLKFRDIAEKKNKLKIMYSEETKSFRKGGV